jgi:Transcriptional regulators
MIKNTIREIAKLSGFSIKTVSRVINDEPNVKPTTKDKVLKVISETNYKPNIYAANLNNKKTKNVLISIRKTHGQHTTKWFDILMSYLVGEASRKKYTLIQEVIYDDSDLQNSILERSGGYIDVIVLFYLTDDDKRFEVAQKNNIPYLAFEKTDYVPLTVSNNNRKGMQEAARFLFSRGLTQVCLLLGAHMNVNQERARAMIEAYEQDQVSLDQLEIVYNMSTLEDIDRFVEERIEQNRLPQVFFVSGDEKVIAVYHSLYRHGLSIPQDVSVIGFDNIPISQYYTPPLTTVGQDFEQLALKMFDIIDQILENKEDIRSVEVDPKLIIRDSVKK